MTIYTLAADPAANGGSIALAAVVVPFITAMALFLISPLLTAKIKNAVAGQIAEKAHRLNMPRNKSHLTPEEIDIYIEYAADAVQILPLTLLPVVGAIFAIAAHVTSVTALVYLGVAVLTAVAVEAWLMSQPAGKYVARRLLRYYSVAAVIGFASNLLGLTIILIYGP